MTFFIIFMSLRHEENNAGSLLAFSSLLLSKRSFFNNFHISRHAKNGLVGIPVGRFAPRNFVSGKENQFWLRSLGDLRQ
jgi:hypothetical protein